MEKRVQNFLIDNIKTYNLIRDIIIANNLQYVYIAIVKAFHGGL